MVRSRSPRRDKRKRSRSRSRSREKERNRERESGPARSVDRDRERERDRRRHRRSKSRSPRRHHRSSRRSRSGSPNDDDVVYTGTSHITDEQKNGAISTSKSKNKNKNKDKDKPNGELEDITEEELAMRKAMGFSSFDSTKGKKVDGTDLSCINVVQKRKYRQYMNRRGGFNRPLDFVA